MTRRVCNIPNCAVICDGPRCTTHARAADNARGTRQQRGYDNTYDRERASWQRRMDAGEAVMCWRCAELGQPHAVDPRHWHLGHDNRDRSIIRGPQCPDTNLSDAGKAAHAPPG